MPLLTRGPLTSNPGELKRLAFFIKPYQNRTLYGGTTIANYSAQVKNVSKYISVGEIMNAIELLKADHDKVEELFKQVEADEDGDHQKLFEQIKTELDVHAHIEEVIFYPKLKEEGDEELKDVVLEGIEEHRQVKMFLKELDNLTDDSEKFDPKLKVLMEDVRHHVEEEEGEMFPKTESQFDEAVLEELGAAMEEEKATFKKSLKAAA
jgi:hemerythrin superfamily protein